MAEGYRAVIGQRLLFWSGWFFTVFGVIVSLYLSKEWAWIAWLILVAALLTLGTYSWWVHQRLAEARSRHSSEIEEKNKRHLEEVARRELVERRLAEVPADAFDRLAGLVSEGAIKELIALMTSQAEMIGRLRLFSESLTRPLGVRKFERVRGELYVIAKAGKGAEAALSHLQAGDPFVLFRQSDSGVEVEVARLSVHQPPAAEIVFFKVATGMADDIAHLTGLAIDGPVEGLKGYRLELAVEVSKLSAADFTKVAETIPYLAAGLIKARRM